MKKNNMKIILYSYPTQNVDLLVYIKHTLCLKYVLLYPHSWIVLNIILLPSFLHQPTQNIFSGDIKFVFTMYILNIWY